jgi:ribosome-associated translation inhibitor RaiA
MPLTITVSFQGMDPSEALRAEIERRAQKLLQFAPRLIGCHTTVTFGEQRHQQGNRYLVRVRATMPGGEFDAGGTPPLDQSHQDVYVAVRDAFDALRRQLEDHVRIQRGEVKALPSDPNRSMRH